MKQGFAHQPWKGSTAAKATWLQSVQSPAFVGVFLAMLILLLAWPRLTGPSWTTLQMPVDLRESEGNTVQWEQHLHFTSLRATLQSDAVPVLNGAYSTDRYRALFPTYVAALFAYWLDSSYMGFALVDLLGWWIGSWALYYLARRLGADNLTALMAAVLLAASPLLVSHMWRNAVHVAHSASLVPCFLVALLLLSDERLAHVWRVVGLASVLYVASLTYQYQWIIVPCLLSLAVVERRRWAWLLAIVAAAVLFVGMTFFTYQVLALVGLPVFSKSNDPLAVVSSRLAHIVAGDVSVSISSFLPLIDQFTKAYHPFIVLLAILGLIFAPARLRILVLTGTALGLAAGYLHAVPWVLMNGYPFLYISAGLALVQGPRWLAEFIARMGNGRYPQFAARIASVSKTLAVIGVVVLVVLAVWSTNADIIGDYSFAQQWWGSSYKPT